MEMSSELLIKHLLRGIEIMIFHFDLKWSLWFEEKTSMRKSILYL